MLTTGEYCLLLASLESKLNGRKFHCGSCITQYGTSERLVQKTMRKRKSKGCFGPNIKKYLINNVRFLDCVGNHAVPIDYFIEAYRLYELGMLPFKGNLGEQPNKIIEIFQLIEVRRNVLQQQNAKDSEG